MDRQLTIAVDAMGGDHAPRVVVEGLALAHVRHPEVRFLLVGDHQQIEPLLGSQRALEAVSQVRHAPDVIGMADKPSQALRSGRASSLWRAIEAVRAGDAMAIVSGGNTGALMAMAKIQLRTLEGIERPAIAAIWPTLKNECIVLDVGANVEANAKQLADFAIMGAEFARAVLGQPRPTVGLLNIGAEELKGNDEVRAAAQLLQDAENLPIDFRGFVEGDDIGKGVVDVVVTDGFTGNVALKTAEGTARQIGSYLKAALTRSLFSRIGYFFARGALEAFREKVDPRRVNGGVFLGLNGLVVKSHGGTDAMGFASAVDLAIDMAKADVTRRIADDVRHAIFHALSVADTERALP